jgi:hypothetical protein
LKFKAKILSIIKDQSHGSSRLHDDIIDAFLFFKYSETEMNWALAGLLKIDNSFILPHYLLKNLQNVNRVVDLREFLIGYQKKWSSFPDLLFSRWVELQDLSNKTILTHSHSGVVIDLLVKARENSSFTVIQTESLPGGEGEMAAKELTKNNIDTRLIKDTAIQNELKNIDLVLLGMDQFNEEYFVNKIGSEKLVTICKQLDIPVFVPMDPRKRVEQLNFNHTFLEKIELSKVLLISPDQM